MRGRILLHKKELYMDIIDNISSQLLNVDENNINKSLITSILLKLEDYTKALKKQKKPAPTPIIKVSENLTNLFEGFLLDTIPPTSIGLDLIKKSIELLKKSHGGLKKKKEKDLVAAVTQINQKMDLLLSGQEIVEAQPEQSSNEDEKKSEKKPSLVPEDQPMDYDLPIKSEEDALIYVEFIHESTEHIDKIESKILELENNPKNAELLNDVFRPFHSMKGAAGFLGLIDINKLSHEAETVLDLARKNKIQISKKMIDILLESVDIIKRLLFVTTARIDQKLGKIPDDEKIQGVPIGQTLCRLHDIATQPIAPAAETSEAEKVEYNQGSRLGEILVQKGDITSAQFDEALQSQQKKIGEILVDKGVVAPSKINEALKIQQGREQKGQKVVPPIKVDTEKLDILMELVGELVIAQTLVNQDKDLLKDNNQKLSKNISNLGKITKVLQEQVMAIRMVPLKQTFMRMHRLVRDVSNKTRKKVELRLMGEDTEIDKTVVDELNDPLLHLLRNSIDHGIELPEDRIKAAKNETGIIQLNAFHQGGNVVIEVTDDGNGLSKDKIYNKAIERNLINKSENYSDQEIFNLILLPGFSTVKVASDISGRGVGLDVVARFIKKLGGKLEISSRDREGSAFTIKLPLTMSIVDGMVVLVGEHRYIIPTISILQSIRPTKKAIITVKKEGELINVRGQLYPLIRLHKLFDVAPVYNKPWEALVVLVESNGRIKGFMVDDLLEQQQVVIKNLGKVFRPVQGISGGAILGDGRVGLILDAESLISLS